MILYLTEQCIITFQFFFGKSTVPFGIKTGCIRLKVDFMEMAFFLISDVSPIQIQVTFSVGLSLSVLEMTIEFCLNE